MKFMHQRLDTLPQGRRERSKSSVEDRTDVVPPAAENPWSRSLWLEGVVEDVTPREPLSGDHTCDVAIVGAGFGGLWTAYYLKAADPSLRVTVIEAEIAGFGAAGRNGGFISPGIAGSGGTLRTRQRVGRRPASRARDPARGRRDRPGYLTGGH